MHENDYNDIVRSPIQHCEKYFYIYINGKPFKFSEMYRKIITIANKYTYDKCTQSISYSFAMSRAIKRATGFYH